MYLCRSVSVAARNSRASWECISCHDRLWQTSCSGLISVVFTDHFSGPGRAVGVQFVCVLAITFDLYDVWPRYLACCFILTLYRPSFKFKVIGHSSTSQDEKCSLFSYGCTLRCDVCILNHQRAVSNMHTTCSLLVVSQVLYWSGLCNVERECSSFCSDFKGDMQWFFTKLMKSSF